MDVVLEARDVAYRYPGAETPALDGASLAVRHGEFVLLTGPSGCGKSTLLRCFLGLIPHLHGGDLTGQVTVFGQDVAQTLPHRLAPRLGMVFQNPEDQLVATAVEADVAFGPENLGLPRGEVAARVERALARTGIVPLRARSVHLISAGQQQRVALASVLALEPEALLLDEPTSQLDPRSSRLLLAELGRLRRELGLTVVLAEHRLELALPLADRLVVMARGRVVRDGPTRAIAAQDGLAGLGVGLPRVVELTRSGLLAGTLALSVDEVAERVMETAGRGPNPPCPSFAALRTGSSRRGKGGTVPAPPSPAGKGAGGLGPSPLVSVRDLRHVYSGGLEALRGVSLEIAPGEAVALLGESGAGKTTLAKHLNGLLRPTSGQVVVGGLDAARTMVGKLAGVVGYVFQNPLHQLFAESVEEELALGPRAQGWSRSDVARRVDELLAGFGLERYRRRHPLALSEGERRRVALAATLAARPRLLVLDEPTVGQDQGEKRRLGDTLERLRAAGHAVVVITHDVEFAADHCPRFVVLAGGEVLADGPSGDVLRRSEVLAAAALEPPQLAQLGARLAPLGFDPACVAIEEVRQELARLLGTRSPKSVS